MELDFDLDILKSLISDFDLMSILPDLADVMEWIVKGVNMAIVIGPVILAVLGLWYLLLPTREANHFIGYRFFWGMGSVKSWKFTQRLAGGVWLYLGITMAMEAYGNKDAYVTLETIELMYKAIEIILDQIVTVVVGSLAVNVVVFILFNYKGNVRRLWRMLIDWIRDLIDQARDNMAAKRADNK